MASITLAERKDKLILFKCDRCGSVIAPYVHKISVEAFANTDFKCDCILNHPGVTEDSEYVPDHLADTLHAMHLCRTCIEEIGEFAMRKPETPAPIKGGPQVKIDLGKLRALYEAHLRGEEYWSVKEIAKELGCTDTTVRYHLQKMGYLKPNANKKEETEEEQ